MNQVKESFISLINQYKPKPDEIWYHYCSAESFMAIIKNKTLRLCDILHMNDKTELLHGERLFDDILKDATIDDFKKEAIRSIYYTIRERMVLLAMSFSANDDQLSQWRGYADDAKGFCIGFEAITFNNLPVHLLQIEYDIEAQRRLILDYLCDIESKFPDDLDFDVNDADSIANLQELFSSIKDPSFSEEKEFRVLHAIGEKEDRALYDSFLDGDYKEFIKDDIGFRLVDNIPVPYVDIYYSLAKSKMPIKKVIIGPKNNSEKTDIDHFLQTNGIFGAMVCKSRSTYR